MKSLSLHFSSGPRPSLHRVQFSHTLIGKRRISVRGKGLDQSISQYSFQWTPAVKALSVFFLKHAVFAVSNSENDVLPRMSGGKNTMAASLDLALGKQPEWLRDMFSVDLQGKSLLRRLIRRTNPERKRPGPVVLSLNVKALEPKHIFIYCDGVVLTKAEEIRELISGIMEGSNHASRISSHSLSKTQIFPYQQEPKYLTRAKLQKLIATEVSDMLMQSDIFNKRFLKQTMERVKDHPYFSRIAGKKVSLISPIDAELSSRHRLGASSTYEELKHTLASKGMIRCVVPWIEIAPLALFEYLKRIKGFPLEIDYKWGYTAEVRRALLKDEFTERPDLCVFGNAPAATVIQQGDLLEFRPLMLMPSMSHRVISPRASQNNDDPIDDFNVGEYNFLCEEASTPEFCFSDLEESGFVKRRKVGIAHLEPDEATLALRGHNPDLRMIMFFPHYSVNELFNNCRLSSLPDPKMNLQEGVLFASDAFLADYNRAQAMDIALRKAWLDLRANPQLVNFLVNQLVADNEFVGFFSRMSGLHNLPDVRIEGMELSG